jgi:hypothetical protein
MGDGAKPAAIRFHDVVIGHVVDIGVFGLKASHNLLIRVQSNNAWTRSDCPPSQQQPTIAKTNNDGDIRHTAPR